MLAMWTDRHGTNSKLYEKQICGTNDIFQSKKCSMLLPEIMPDAYAMS